jgi:hypothetical protein
MIDEKPYEEEGTLTSGNRHITGERDVFGNEEDHQIKYKTLSWQLVAVLMIAEIVSNGMLSLPSSGGVVGLVPNVILIVVRTSRCWKEDKLLICYSSWASSARSRLICWSNCKCTANRTVNLFEKNDWSLWRSFQKMKEKRLGCITRRWFLFS